MSIMIKPVMTADMAAFWALMQPHLDHEREVAQQTAHRGEGWRSIMLHRPHLIGPKLKRRLVKKCPHWKQHD